MTWFSGAYRRVLGVGFATPVERRSILGARVLLAVRYHARGSTEATAALRTMRVHLTPRGTVPR